jgi:hypothetical protein
VNPWNSEATLAQTFGEFLEIVKVFSVSPNKKHNRGRHDHREHQSAQDKPVDHSFRIEIHGARRAAARTWIDHVAAVTAGNQTHGLEFLCWSVEHYY